MGSKILIAEDNKTEIEVAKMVFGKTRIVETLEDGLKEIENNPDNYQVLVTDLYYPTGDLIFKEEFDERLGSAILDSYKFAPFNYPEETRLFAQSVKDGRADEIPSGALLSIYALLKKGIRPVWISSHEHHGSKSDFMTWFLRGPIREYSCLNEGFFIEGTDRKKKKWWGEARKMTQYFNRCELPKVNEMLNDHKLMDLKIVRLALELPKYFKKQNS